VYGYIAGLIPVAFVISSRKLNFMFQSVLNFLLLFLVQQLPILLKPHYNNKLSVCEGKSELRSFYANIQEEIRRRLNSGNACYHSVQSLLSSRLLAKNLKIRMYKMIILLVVLYGCETWSLTLREEHRLRLMLSIGL
jgi:hypothetical protein